MNRTEKKKTNKQINREKTKNKMRERGKKRQRIKFTESIEVITL